ncbi:MAG: F0F1 ATP synthase subunit A [Ruminococcaceae bacterium]|nr:F0F1 ATP synthase subunit A [Oscillospiraceae bacterium]
MKNLWFLGVSAVLSAVCLIGYFLTKNRADANPDDPKAKKTKKVFFFGLIFMGWFFLGTVCNILLGGSKGIHVEFEMFSPRVELFGISFAETSLIAVGVTVVILAAALWFRFFCVPKFSDDKPTKVQLVMEFTVEWIDKYTHSSVEAETGCLSSYLMAVALYMAGCAAAELFGLRAPTSDITVTFALGLITFFLINYYSIRKKHLSGRIKGMASPTPVVFPFRIISDIAVPVSLACRLFGNMLGGLIVMELLKGVLGGYMFGIAPVAGLYFNLFHPLIQTYIFITLSLTFINEACEGEGYVKKEKKAK